MLVDGVVIFASGVELHGAARNLTKYGNKGKYGRQAALNRLMVGQGLGRPYHGGRLTRNTRAYIYIYMCILNLSVKL